jgi:membrane protease YdiL (CAAX protease family)
MLFFDAKATVRDPRLGFLEPALVLCLIILYIWWLREGHQWWAFAIFALILISHYWHGESPQDLGFSTANFRDCFTIFSPALLFVALLLLGTGILLDTLRPLYLERAIVGFISYCCWGLFQQYLLNAYFVNRLLPSATNTTEAAALGAGCFACAHTPNWFLMLVGFVAGYCAARVWIRYRNLYFLGMAHGVIGSLLYVVVPDSVSHHLCVGPGWFGH